MKFDLFYELSVPQWLNLSEQQVYDQTLEELALADQLGYNAAWLVEHHFMPEYSHSSSPALFLAAAAQITRQLRLGHAIIPLPYHHPVQVAEQLATLDLLSHGRVEFGFGRGFSPPEYQTFDVAMSESRERTDEALALITEAFATGKLHFRGKYYSVDGLEILPKPVQQCGPPIWTAAVSPESFALAGEKGIGALAGPFKPWFMIREDIKTYHRAWRKYQPVTSKPRTGMTLGILCLEDRDRARKLGKPAFEWFYQKLLGQTKPILSKLYESYEYYKRMGRLHTLLEKTINLRVLETMGMVIVGTPRDCIKRIKALEIAGVDHVLLAIGGGAVSSELAKESMSLIADKVMPHFSRDLGTENKIPEIEDLAETELE